MTQQRPSYRTYIPAALQQAINDFLDHEDYAPYVLDGQTAETEGEHQENYHDVIVVEDGAQQRILKFTMLPDKTITIEDAVSGKEIIK